MEERVNVVSEELARLYMVEKVAIAIEKPEPEYVLHLTSQCFEESEASKIAATSSEFRVRLYTADTLTFCSSFHAHDKTITGVRFSHTNHHNLYTCSMDGSIRTWDIRQNCSKPCQEFNSFADTNNIFTCVDISCDGYKLCAGTEATESGDVLVNLWDTRKAPTPSRHFSETHTGDITQVCFHPRDPDVLLSGSTDGLVCYYNLTEIDEDEAIESTMNTESSVSKLGFRGKGNEYIYATTHIESFHLWKSEEDFDDIVNLTDIREKYQNVEYLVDCFGCDWLDDKVCILAGSSSGQGQILSLQGQELVAEFQLPEGHSDVIRSVTWCQGPRCLVTGGEDSMLCAWNLSDVTKTKSKDNLKTPSELKTKVKKKVRKSGKPF